MFRKLRSGIIWLVLGLGGIVLAGCGAQVENAALKQARATYSEAQSRPEVVANAPVMLREAEEILRQAEQADDEEKTEHLAYLAEKRAEIAMSVGEREEARNEAERLGQTKQRLLLEAREREAAQARQRAESRTMELEEARSAAEIRAMELEEARRAVEMRAQEAEQARAELQELQREISELKARQTPRGIVLTLGGVLFAVNEAELLPGAMRSIDKVAEFLKEHPERQVRIEGHTDSTGSAEYNQELSERRARSVSQALQREGIDAARISTEGMGEQYPVASNENPGGRQQNRRVEIIILNEEETTTPAR